MPSYRYAGETPRAYPYPPIARTLEPGDVVELDDDQVPVDGRFLDPSGAVVRPPVPAPADETATADTAPHAVDEQPTATSPTRAAAAALPAAPTFTAVVPAAAAVDDDKDA